ncbi:hypothetical protein VB773_19815 [Haloarculaceae archaeon H-GB2-1]|nr:hypothetical protein [Haloarculaceae archaeon H-GB1-1]MEA5409602.1 hypothetical protein [Haloarculaceae archaeon H-GB2-1]
MGLFTSSSDPSKLKHVQNNSEEFVESLHAKDVDYGAVAGFNGDYEFGRFRPEHVRQEISALEASGDTALYDSLITSMYAMQEAQARHNQSKVPALLLTHTDGEENASDASLEHVRKAISKPGFHP